MSNSLVIPNAIYGIDLVVQPNANGVLDILPTLQMTTGQATDTLAQSLVARQMCALKSIQDAPSAKTIDLRTLLRDGMTSDTITNLPNQLTVILQDDQRVTSAAVSGTFDPVAQIITLTEVITPSSGPTFTLTLAVSAVSVQAVTT